MCRVGCDERLQHGGPQSFQRMECFLIGWKDGSRANDVPGVIPSDKGVPPVSSAPGGSIAASINERPHGGPHGGIPLVRVVNGDPVSYPTGGSAAFRGSKGGCRRGVHSTVAGVKGDSANYPAWRSVAIDRRCVGRRSRWESTVAPVQGHRAANSSTVSIPAPSMRPRSTPLPSIG